MDESIWPCMILLEICLMKLSIPEMKLLVLDIEMGHDPCVLIILLQASQILSFSESPCQALR